MADESFPYALHIFDEAEELINIYKIEKQNISYIMCTKSNTQYSWPIIILFLKLRFRL